MADQVLKINGTILFKRGSTLQLENEPIIPQLGEPVFDTETRRLKIGDGENRYIDLPYIGECEDEILEGYFDGTKFFADTGKTEEMFGNTATLYVDLMTNKVYRWSGSVFVEISPNVKITETITNSSSDETVPVAKAVYEYGQEILAEGKNEISKLSAKHDEEFAAARIEATTALEKEIARAMTAEEEIADRVASLEDTKDDYIAADVSAIKESNAYADSLNANMDARVKVLEAIDHEAINQELIDLAADYIAADTEITNAFTAEDNAIKANVQKLFDDLALLNEDVNENISDLLNTIVKTREDFEAADQVLTTEITTAYETYTNAKAEEIFEVINNLPSVDLGTVESDLADHKATAEATFAEIRSAFAEADGVIRTEYQNADNILSATCEAENAAIRGEIAAGDLKIATDLASEIARATAAEAQTLTDAKAYINEVKANLLGDGVLNETYDTLVEISNWIADSGVDTAELTSAIASETADRQKEDAAILAKLNEEVNALDVRITALDATHTEDLSKTNANLTTLGNELRQEDNSIKDSINALRTELKAYFDTQLGVIENGSY